MRSEIQEVLASQVYMVPAVQSAPLATPRRAIKENAVCVAVHAFYFLVCCHFVKNFGKERHSTICCLAAPSAGKSPYTYKN